MVKEMVGFLFSCVIKIFFQTNQKLKTIKSLNWDQEPHFSKIKTQWQEI